MPVLEFAMDSTALNRVQVHLSTHQGPVSVMLNRNVLGSLTTIEEQRIGKDFRLADNSTLRVRIINGHPQAWHNGHILLLTSVSGPLPSSEEQSHGSMGKGVITLLTLNVLVIGGLSIWFAGDAIMSMPSSRLFLPYMLSSLLGLPGVVGVLTLLTWKKWGFYLAVGYVFVLFVLAFVYAILTYRIFIPLLSLALLYFALRSNSIWRKME